MTHMAFIQVMGELLIFSGASYFKHNGTDQPPVPSIRYLPSLFLELGPVFKTGRGARDFRSQGFLDFSHASLQ